MKDLSSVDYISASANSTVELDRAEARAIQKVFGRRAKEVPVSSLKSMIGEFDGSGGIRACAVALSLYNGFIPPTLGTQEIDPQCDLNVILDQPQKMEIRSALLNACSTGGSNISLWFRRYESGGFINFS